MRVTNMQRSNCRLQCACFRVLLRSKSLIVLLISYFAINGAIFCSVARARLDVELRLLLSVPTGRMREVKFRERTV
jgi:hypothetical protein